jgi:hypothetical protein
VSQWTSFKPQFNASQFRWFHPWITSLAIPISFFTSPGPQRAILIVRVVFMSVLRVLTFLFGFANPASRMRAIERTLVHAKDA